MGKSGNFDGSPGWIFDDVHQGKISALRLFCVFFTSTEDDANDPEFFRRGNMERKHNILIVDDKEISRKFLKSLLNTMGYNVHQAENGVQALTVVQDEIDLVLLDALMPEMDGFETTRRIRMNEATRDLPVIMVTALDEKQDRLKAIEAGANDFLTKPVDRTELSVRVASLLKMKCYQDEIKRHKVELERKVAEQTADLVDALACLKRAHQKTSRAHIDTIRRLCAAAEYKDGDTGSHIKRVGGYCEIIAGHLGLPATEVQTIKIASAMHDIGKIGIPDQILLKPGKLTDEEWKTMRQHCYIGVLILQGSESELLKAGKVVAYSHHEKWDGTGYPRGLAGNDIPLYGRICALADTFDALTTKRAYKEAFENEKAFQILEAGRDKAFDPDLLDIFLNHQAEILQVQNRYRQDEIDDGALPQPDRFQDFQNSFLKTIIPLIKQESVQETASVTI
jgi:putative two-component system response regulator